MSGGVDSTATALLLLNKYDLTGYFMRLNQPDFEDQHHNVTHIADKLGINLKVIDLRKPFQEKVLEYFSSQYFNGLTPNPCVVCNKLIKFGLFLDEISKDNISLVATGHYAIVKNNAKSLSLSKGADPTKDQSYFLSRLSQSQLDQIIFPLGSWHKKETYEFVKKNGFNQFENNESQDVCFLADQTVGEYLSSLSGTQQKIPAHGDIIDVGGNILGKHKGIHHYTIGQRKGLGISSTSPLYVIKLVPELNHVIVGRDTDLFSQKILVNQIHWINEERFNSSQTYSVKIRYTHRGSEAKIQLKENDFLEINFTEPQRAVTPGQFAVIYDDDEVIGSGVII